MGYRDGVAEIKIYVIRRGIIAYVSCVPCLRHAVRIPNAFHGRLQPVLRRSLEGGG
jgi:hypothetical protein